MKCSQIRRFCEPSPVASLTKEVNSGLAKCPLVFNRRLANRGLTSLVKEATGVSFTDKRSTEIMAWICNHIHVFYGI